MTGVRPDRGSLRGKIALLLVALSACSDNFLASRSRDAASALEPVKCSAGGQVSFDDLRLLVEAVIDGRDAVLGALSSAERAELQELYQLDEGAPLWIDTQGRPTTHARVALQRLSEAADDGLVPADYHDELLARLEPRLNSVSSFSAELALFDVAVSAGMLRYLRHVHMGRIDPRTIGFRLDVPRDQHDFAAMLRTAMAEQRVTSLADDLLPPLAQYRLLRAMLPRYRALAGDPALVAPRSITRAIHPGEFYGETDVLQHELIALGDLPADTPRPRGSGRYEGTLVDGIKRFQSRHGLEPDGVVGNSTITALRVPLTWRVRQVELALERFRWLPHLGEERLIALNIPMFRLWTWDMISPNAAPLFSMDVIVGRALSTQTPVFVAQMGEVIFRPYWNVPRSILRHEVLPKIEHDPEYCAGRIWRSCAARETTHRVSTLQPTRLPGCGKVGCACASDRARRTHSV